MEVKWDNIEEVMNTMTDAQIRLAMKSIAVVLKREVVVDMNDFIDSVKLGLSWPSKVE
jgi:hypothetical protein